jgi:hypothetical protein
MIPHLAFETGGGSGGEVVGGAGVGGAGVGEA